MDDLVAEQARKGHGARAGYIQDWQRIAVVPNKGVQMCRVWQTTDMAAPAVEYRDETVLEFVGRAMANSGYTLDTALYEWYRKTEGQEAANQYYDRFIYRKGNDAQ